MGSMTMSQFAQSVCLVLLCSFTWSVAPLMAEEPFGLPACASDFQDEAVLNSAVLDTMIAQAEPTGARPDREQAMQLIVVKHYLDRGNSLLILPRTDPQQAPILLRDDCLPYPAGSPQTRLPLTDLTAEQKQTLITYYNLVAPPVIAAQTPTQPAPMDDTMVPIPIADTSNPEEQSTKTKTVAIDIYEVTNEAFKQFFDDRGYETQSYWSEMGWGWVQSSNRQQPSYWENDQLNQPNQPVVGVTWYEADAYCRWAGKTLVTEAVWESACQGPDKLKYPWGNEPLPIDNTETKTESPETQPLSTVGSSPATKSPYGVQDMAGSVLEWTATLKDTGDAILRGGSGPSTSPRVGCHVSHNLLPGMSANFIGFRCQANDMGNQ